MEKIAEFSTGHCCCCCRCCWCSCCVFVFIQQIYTTKKKNTVIPATMTKGMKASILVWPVKNSTKLAEVKPEYNRIRRLTSNTIALYAYNKPPPIFFDAILIVWYVHLFPLNNNHLANKSHYLMVSRKIFDCYFCHLMAWIGFELRFLVKNYGNIIK